MTSNYGLHKYTQLLFRPQPNQPAQAPHLSLYDHLSSGALLLLHSLSHEPSPVMPRKSVDTITDLANNAIQGGRPWHALQALAFSMTQGGDSRMRECTFREVSYVSPWTTVT